MKKQGIQTMNLFMIKLFANVKRFGFSNKSLSGLKSWDTDKSILMKCD